MQHLSYIIETNGENGCTVAYVEIDYTPSNIVWVANVNSFAMSHDLPDAEDYLSPEYVRQATGAPNVYKYYRKTVCVPSKSSTFMVGVLVNGAQANAYVFDNFSDFLSIVKQGAMLNVKSGTNIERVLRNGTITIADTTYGETISIPIVQSYTPIGLQLSSYESDSIDGESEGEIGAVSFEHTFHWLTKKTSGDKEWVEFVVDVSGPRNAFIIYDVSEYVYKGQMDATYGYSGETGKYYETIQVCSNNGLQTIQREVEYDEDSEGVYGKVRYGNDLKIDKVGNRVRITNYGRCFLEDDAYYVVTLANADDLRNTVTIVIRYVDDSTVVVGNVN